ncbi:MAG: hypothetical protein XE11_0888 [Methanomicrobiales archaeon 53_19]|uniref:proteasome assembly chaperone family protein n=1 Tax=Methanocalculus sp. TaxID=2004547 RepID=UPI000749F9DC|nr:proteasome assembly chaperone family protein [Methanocalculus sp.]KUK70832.1 MAG: hypothetical protein XD88_0409 [Methanocalculus sp. 52_23]KUL04027.1 MAG: hypothetical protein XE11_0888 [Methanomicrobiales archaeon 53_19]HIJ06771.1 proteasome assembly chaperone family protein [Methanocalculus sp.]
MDPVTISYAVENTDDYRASILIEGLPGVGHVGKLVADHIVDELDGVLLARIISHHFPPQVFITKEGVVNLPKNELYLVKSDPPLLLLTGDCQSTSPEGHYILTEEYLNLAERFGVQRIYTLGGYGVGRLVDEPRVLCAADRPALIEEAVNAGSVFSQEEPPGGIIGAAGLLLGLGTLRGMEGVALLGETSGYLVDPISAGSVLTVLSKMIGLYIDPSRLQETAAELEGALEKLKESEQDREQEDLSYIG